MPFLLVSLLVPILPLELPKVAEPPMPDFKTRVDYVQWYKDQLKFAEQDNAYQEYSRFMRASRQPQISETVSSQMNELLKFPRPWRPNRFPGLARWLVSMEPHLEAYKNGSNHSFFAAPVYDNPGTMVQIMLPGLSPGKLLSKAMIVKAWQADGGFDGNKFVTHMAIVNRYANHISQGMTLVDHLVAIGTKFMLYQNIVQAVHADLLSENDFAKLRSILVEGDSRNWALIMNRSFPTELATTYDFVQTICTENGTLQPKVSRSALTKLLRDMGGKLPQAQLKLLLNEDPVKLCEKARDHWHLMMDMCSKSFPENVEEEFRKKYDPMVKSSPFFQVFLANVERALFNGMRVETQRRGVQLLLTLAIHKKKHGKWPESLKDLSLKPDRIIQIDPRSGKEFIYRVMGDKMTLYSVGKDGQDNGGKQFGPTYEGQDGEDLVIWPVQTRK